MVKRGRTVKVNKEEGLEFLNMAKGFQRASEYALRMEDWKVAGSNAIHCAISANDALLGLKHKVRSGSRRHSDAASLLGELEMGDEARRNVQRLSRMISKKTMVEYEGRPFTRREANSLVTDAQRFLSWVIRETQDHR